MDRISFLKLVTFGAFLVLFSGLISAQIFSGSYYRRLAEGNRLREVTLPASRGIIFDRKGVALTLNEPSFSFDGREVSKDESIALEAEGKKVLIATKRRYLFGSLLAHVVGYVDSDGRGQSGVELIYENWLRGQNGKELVEVDAVGEKLRTLSVVPPAAGKNLSLAIDLDLQRTVGLAMEGKKGAVVVSIPKNGEVLALYSAPSFDPNTVASFLQNEGKPLFNRAISGTYPPGSTFKIVTAVAGLETRAISQNTLIEDTGVISIGEYQFPNWKWLRHKGTDGWVNVVDALAKSNDIFFYRLGEKVGKDKLFEWAQTMGLGAPLGIDLPGEAAGSLGDKEKWYLGDTYHWAIGQGNLLATPLQVNFWTNVIASGGQFCRPRIVISSNNQGLLDGRQGNNCRTLGIRQETIAVVKQGMVAACSSGGTAYPLFGFAPPVACKTGTAEFGTEGKTHAWLTAFAPADNPEISVTVLVEGGGEGSDVAAPVAKKILVKYFRGE